MVGLSFAQSICHLTHANNMYMIPELTTYYTDHSFLSFGKKPLI